MYNDNGEIIANQLVLGSGATIKKYIKLGNAWIINPIWLNSELSLEQTLYSDIITENKLQRDSFITIKDDNKNTLLNIKQNGQLLIGKDNCGACKSFEKVIEKSPKEYLTGFRIRQACNLLEHSDLSITAIANSVGFENNLYFSKAFHKAKGMSPKNYRLAACFGKASADNHI